ncbi:DnaD domain-containing protein [Pseudalkalibacillus caeni]|uniref:DnaD domain protein n=1 Tax=Exobacillus caeni TaxID=2574798 RepID=A0A5R9EZI7_9BACL|nr:DnaD domain-containing protein [Pseudalkalibacillus caeni]TLS35879.1 DnaD domain protein [Pseudalkalibacillus caeni]
MKKENIIRWLTEGQVAVPKLLLQHYKHIGLNEEECLFLIQLHTFLEAGNPFPTPEEIASNMTYTAQNCMEMIRTLMKKNVLAIEDHQDTEKGYYSESYSIYPLWEKILVYLEQEEKQEQLERSQDEESNLYSIFENEFARPLSPIECETLAMWIDVDGHPPHLIKASLKEAVLAGKLNFRYIDRILFEWKRNGIKTLEQARAYGEKFRKYNQDRRPGKKTKEKEEVSYPFYNWLEQS